MQCQRGGACDLGYFDRMGNASAVQIALVIHKHLGLVDQAAKGVGVDDSIAIALKFGAEGGFGLRVTAAARQLGVGGIGGQTIRPMGTRLGDRGTNIGRRSLGILSRCIGTAGYVVHAVIRSKYSTCAAKPVRGNRLSRMTRRWTSRGSIASGRPTPSYRSACAPTQPPASPPQFSPAAPPAPATDAGGPLGRPRPSHTRGTWQRPSTVQRRWPRREATGCSASLIRRRGQTCGRD